MRSALIQRINKISLLKGFDSLLGRFLAGILPRPLFLCQVEICSVLFIRPGGIGDALLLVPAIQAFRARYPGAKIYVLAEQRNASAFTLIPDIVNVFTYDSLSDLVSLFQHRFDLIIDTEQWHRLSAVCTRILPSSRKIGFDTNNRRRMFTDQVSYSQSDYEAQSFINLLKPLGVIAQFDHNSSFLNVPRQTSDELSLGNSYKRPVIVVSHSASVPERRWGSLKFNQLVKRLSDDGCTVVIIGGKEDVTTSAEIVNGTNALNFAGETSLLGTAAIIARSDLLVSSDSGVLHLGVGLGIATLSMFGSGIAAKWAPRGSKSVVLSEQLSCSPCTLFGTTPPCSSGIACLDKITVEVVYSNIITLLNSSMRPK